MTTLTESDRAEAIAAATELLVIDAPRHRAAAASAPTPSFARLFEGMASDAERAAGVLAAWAGVDVRSLRPPEGRA